MRLVIDASIAAKWSLDEPGSASASRLIEVAGRLVAPDLLFAELANICWRKVRAGEIADDHGEIALAFARQVIRSTLPTASVAARALAIALELDHPACDAVYLACAEAEDGTMVTADRRLSRKVAGTALAARLCLLGEAGWEARLGLPRRV